MVDSVPVSFCSVARLSSFALHVDEADEGAGFPIKDVGNDRKRNPSPTGRGVAVRVFGLPVSWQTGQSREFRQRISS